MEDLTFDGFVAKMNEADISPEEFTFLAEGDMPSDMYDRVQVEGKLEFPAKPEWVVKEEVFKSLGTVEQVKQHGGEGMGSEYYNIYKIGDFFLKIEGYYTSYDGTDYDSAEFEEVRPFTKTVTVFE